jgi:hypothetical protein
MFGQLAQGAAVGYVGEPPDIAAVVSFLASKESHLITGQSVSISAPNLFAPDALQGLCTDQYRRRTLLRLKYATTPYNRANTKMEGHHRPSTPSATFIGVRCGGRSDYRWDL